MSLTPHNHDPVWTGRRCGICDGRIQARVVQTLGRDRPYNTGWEVACKQRCVNGSGALLTVTAFATEVAEFLATVDTYPDEDETP